VTEVDRGRRRWNEATRRWRRHPPGRLHATGGLRATGLLPLGLAAGLVMAACQPSAPPGFTITPPPGSTGAEPSAAGTSDGPPLVAGSPIVTLDGAVVRLEGLASGATPPFQLPAGEAAMVVVPCASNQVIPFVTLYDATATKLGIIVEPSATLRNLAGGAYTLDVVTNPDCRWAIEITPQ